MTSSASMTTSSGANMIINITLCETKTFEITLECETETEATEIGNVVKTWKDGFGYLFTDCLIVTLTVDAINEPDAAERLAEKLKEASLEVRTEA